MTRNLPKLNARSISSHTTPMISESNAQKTKPIIFIAYNIEKEQMDTIDNLQQELMKLLDSFGTYTTEQKKNSIHVVRERAFVGVHPKKSYLGVNVVLNRSKALPPASKVDQISANRFHHYYKITSKQQLGSSFTELLKEAYDLAQPKE